MCVWVLPIRVLAFEFILISLQHNLIVPTPGVHVYVCVHVSMHACITCLFWLQEIEETLEDERRRQQPSANAFFLCLLSHGAKGQIFGNDGKTIEIDMITTMFDGKNCPALNGKPKVFIIQACQGCE